MRADVENLVSRVVLGAIALTLIAGCDGPTSVTCESDRECSAGGLVCDTTRSLCVECVSSGDCLGAGEVCMANRCAPVTACTSSRQCPGLVCDVARGYCVQCVTAVDCGADQRCTADGTCEALCSVDADCAASGQVCATDTRECVECVQDDQCVAGRSCVERRCQTGRDAGLDAGTVETDGGLDAGADGGPPKPVDAGVDAGANDAGAADAGAADAGAADAGRDAGAAADAGRDAGAAADAGPDAGSLDAGPRDAGPDAGPFDAGPRMSALVSGLGGPVGYGPGELLPSDDGSTAALSIATPFPAGLRYYGATFAQVFMNNNGNLTFSAARTTYSPFPLATDAQATLAPFFGDVDTRSGGRPTMNNVHYFMDASRLVFTWHEVGYYNMHADLRNTFQVVIRERSDVAPGDFDLEYRYDGCEWTTGDASGGTNGFGGDAARAGWAAGDGVRGFELPGSGTMSVLGLCSGSNTGQPGVWRFQFRSGLPQ